MSKERLEAFSDGVFAIILTVLVLELRAPSLPPHSSMAAYGAAMLPLIPKIISFVLTFAVVVMNWVSHHVFFNNLKRVTIPMVWINNVFLLSICFLPFPTAMLGNNPTDQFPVLLYAADALLSALTFFAFRTYATRAQLFEKADLRGFGPRRSIPGIALYGAAVVLAFVNVYLSLLCFLVVPVVYFVSTMQNAAARER